MINTNKFLDDIDLDPIARAIKKKYGSIYSFCKIYQLDQGEVSKILNKKKPPTIRNLIRYCQLLDLRLTVNIQRPRAVST